MPIGYVWQTFLETPLVNVTVALTVTNAGSQDATDAWVRALVPHHVLRFDADDIAGLQFGA